MSYEYRQHEYPAIVVNTDDDPEESLRVQVRILGMFEGVPDVDLPWATYRLPTGCRKESGDFSPSQKDDMVWVDFPFYSHGEPDTRKPRIVASMHYSKDGKPNLPLEAIGKGYDHKKTAARGKYHRSKVTEYNEAVVEYVEGGTLRVFSRVSGAIVEVQPDGRVLVNGPKGIDITSGGDIQIRADKSIKIQAGGDVDIDGNMIYLN